MEQKQLNILITGAGTGIGAELAKNLSIDGHKIIICGRRISRLREVAKSSKNIKYYICDISNENQVKKFNDLLKRELDHLDVIINNAGIFGAIGRIDRTDSKLWKKAFEINTFGTYLITKYFLGLLLKSEAKKIINFAGGGAFNAFPNYSAYAVSKAAVVRLSENAAFELKELGVKVNCIAPGFVATDLHEATLKAGESAGDQFRLTKEKLVKGATPVDIPVGCVKFLISEESGGLTGKTISANFDKWGNDVFKESINEITESELYTMRRINIVNLDGNAALKNKLLEIQK
jgi:NAD(P)-dependent dehydrogenase (short-subunit alcohol dehydrogenase family)